jgi:hypothetical protein
VREREKEKKRRSVKTYHYRINRAARHEAMSCLGG